MGNKGLLGKQQKRNLLRNITVDSLGVPSIVTTTTLSSVVTGTLQSELLVSTTLDSLAFLSSTFFRHPVIMVCAVA